MSKNHYICIFGNYLTNKGYAVEVRNVDTKEEAIKDAEKDLLKWHDKDGWYLEKCNQIWI